MGANPQAASRRRRRRAGASEQWAWLPLVPVLVSAALISSVVVTLGAPLIPLIQQRFGLSVEIAQWSYTITLLVAAACTPVLGRVADGRHRRSVAAVVCVLVSGGCLISAFATAFPLFLVGRGLQGLGVALVAMTIAAARAHLPSGRVASAVALLSITTALGAGISYPISTFVADHWGMSAAFVGAAVFALLVGIAVLKRLPSMPRDREAQGPPPDVAGAVLLMSGVTLLLLAVTQGNAWGWLSSGVVLLASAGVLLCGLWALWQRRATHPLVQLGLLRQRPVLAADVVAVLIGMSLYSTPVLVSRLAQLPQSTGFGAGLSLSMAGVIMIPIAFGNLLGSRITLWARAFGGARFSLVLGSALAMSGALLTAFAPVTVPVLVLAMSLTAVGAGATFGSMPTLIIGAVPPTETGSATSFNLLLRTVGGTIGSAVTAAAIGAHLDADGDVERLGFQVALLFCASACLAAGGAAFVLLRRVSPPGG